MPFARKSRLSELIFQEVSNFVKKHNAPFLNGILTLYDIELSKDLKQATIFFSVLGESDDRDSAQAALEGAQPAIRNYLKGRLRLRFIPRILFRYDSTSENASRIATLLNQIEKEKQ